MLGGMALAGQARMRLAALAALPALLCAATAQARVLGARAAAAPPPVRIAYVTAGPSTPERVWVADGRGGEAHALGLGDEPLIAPDGQLVAASLFGAGAGGQESGPSLAVYPAAGGTPAQFGDIATASALPLAWSPDSRYLAVALQSTGFQDAAATSGLDVLDTATGRLTPIATGFIYGASFAPDGSDRLVYARAPSQSLSAAVNLYVAYPEGGETRRVTDDGRSLNPLWGPRWIAYDRERLRHDDAPEYQVWLRPASASGQARPRRLTDVRVGPLVSGLVPVAFSASGGRLLSEFEGQDTSEAWTASVPSGRARRLRVGRRHTNAIAAGISRSGATLLIDEGFLEGPPSADRVATVPFAGGPAKVLVAHGGQASWNG